MRKFSIAVLVVLAGLCLSANALAAGATKDECIAKTKEAAQVVADKGLAMMPPIRAGEFHETRRPLSGSVRL